LNSWLRKGVRRPVRRRSIKDVLYIGMAFLTTEIMEIME
jgi:hypothetical protein